MKTYDKSELWNSILESDMFQDIDLNIFKEEGANTRITQYSHKTHGILFLKNILFQMATQFQKEELLLLNKVSSRKMGGGITIDYNGISLDLDYLLALDEILFLKDILENVTSVLEIGAGYGRTCHTILSLFPNIKDYHIIDFPNMLNLSGKYLQKVSSEHNYQKITFVPVDNINEQPYDLVINIDSMQEMNADTVCSYLNFIDKVGGAFYSKNTVGKFDPSVCGWEKSAGSELAMQSGILREKVNIFCPLELATAQGHFLERFSPGASWIVQKHAVAPPWSHYYQALYKKNA